MSFKAIFTSPHSEKQQQWILGANPNSEVKLMIHLIVCCPLGGHGIYCLESLRFDLYESETCLIHFDCNQRKCFCPTHL